MSHSNWGAVYVAYGEKALAEAEASAETLKERNPNLPVKIIGHNMEFEMMNNSQRSRWAKLNIDRLSPYDMTLYVDADTRIGGDLSTGFDILEDGFDMALCASEQQDEETLWHVGEEERKETLEQLGYVPLQLQAGVMFVRKSERVSEFFEHWRDEWRYHCDQDQAALLRALAAIPLKIWILGRQWNGSGRHGTLIRHLYGRCR